MKKHLIDLFNLRSLPKNESVSFSAFGVPVGKVKTGAGKHYSLAFFFCFVRDRAHSVGAISKKKK